MPIDPALRSLDIDLPACPRVLVELSMLMYDEDANLQSIAGLIEGDMALASAVVRSVNSAMFGLVRRVDSVPQALNHLGMREVSALTFEIALRGAFAPSAMLTKLWERAGRRGLAMGRSAGPLGIDPWHAHTAGLFAESGQAALIAHDAPGYELMVRQEPDAIARLDAEIAAYGVQHAALGGALCQAWGLHGDVAETVRARAVALRGLMGGEPTLHAEPWSVESLPVRQLVALGMVVDVALGAADTETVQRLSDALSPVSQLDGRRLADAVSASVYRLGS